ncbi:unnamed protein product [Schistocephalus solidus]|uniref:HNH endonuclease n=1 Tax=Schistocephalus solidus TaxID=70667 RepID=A0A183TRI7_SCHSO|nr:unnamed protein product [Schistocephalus solidus]
MARQNPGHGSPRADLNPQHPRHAEASATAMEWLPGRSKRRYEATLKKSLKQLQINTATCEDLARDRTAWRRSVKTRSAIYEANPIAAAKVKRVARKSPAPRTNTAEAEALPTCPRCQRIFRARIGLANSRAEDALTARACLQGLGIDGVGPGCWCLSCHSFRLGGGDPVGLIDF